jgi:hypothetical protein
LAKSCGFWSLTRTMDTYMYLAQSLWIESSNCDLFLAWLITNHPETTSTDSSFLTFDFQRWISRSNVYLETHKALCTSLFCMVLGECPTHWHFAHNMNRHPQPKNPNNSTSWGVTTFGCP